MDSLCNCFCSTVSVVKGSLVVFSQSTPLACLNLLKRTFGKTSRDMLRDLKSPMMQVTQYHVPQLADVSALHLLFFTIEGNTIFYLQLVEVLHSNPYPLHFSCGYVTKEHLSLTKYHIIASILQHGNINQLLLQTRNIHNISQSDERT